jgi:hypothetical protein
VRATLVDTVLVLEFGASWRRLVFDASSSQQVSGIAAGQDDTRPTSPHPCRVDTAAVLENAMTDYVLAAGTNKAPAVGAPEHLAAWLEAHGYRIVRTPDIDPLDPADRARVEGIAARIDWRCVCEDGAGRCSIVRQVLAAVAAAPADVRRVA